MILVVVIILVVILIGIFAFLFYTERKLNKLEKLFGEMHIENDQKK